MNPSGTPIVVIDAGHGGKREVGGSSPNRGIGRNGLLEKDVALDLAKRTAAAVGNRADVRLTRSEDVNVGLRERAETARAADADVFVSIHLNASGDPMRNGPDVRVSPAASAASVALATSLLHRLRASGTAAPKDIHREPWTVLSPRHHSPQTAACIAQIGYLTNAEEARRLAITEHRDAIAHVLAEGILERLSGDGRPHDGERVGAIVPASRGPRSEAVLGAASLAATQLGYGVPGGTITDGFYRNASEKRALTGTAAGRSKHLGIDVSLSNASGGGVDDSRRGLPVYAVVKRAISMSELSDVRVASGPENVTGLGLNGQGDAVLSHAIVLAQPWGSQSGDAYGGVVGLACRYTYTADDETAATITLYLEYLHLLTSTYLPRVPDGRADRTVSADEWAASGKGIGFGPLIRSGARLSANDLCAGDPILVGYLGATRFPHTHLQAAFKAGEQRYLGPRTPAPRFDPAVMLRTSATLGS